MLQSRHSCLLSCKITLSSSDSRNFFPHSNFLIQFSEYAIIIIIIIINILQYLLTVNAKTFKKIIAPFLSYSIFLRGLLFYAAPCTPLSRVTSDETASKQAGGVHYENRGRATLHFTHTATLARNTAHLSHIWGCALG